MQDPRAAKADQSGPCTQENDRKEPRSERSKATSTIIRTEIDNIEDFSLEHIFECGQCFRWVPAETPRNHDKDKEGKAGSASRKSIESACSEGVHAAESGIPAYIGAAGGRAALISFDGSRLTIDSAGGGDEAFWRDYFDLGTDYGEIKRQLAENEPGIKPAAGYGRGIRILRQDPFETIISFIISQNNNIPRIRKNIESLCRRYGERIEGSEELLHLKTARAENSLSPGSAEEHPEAQYIYAFPKPETLAAAEEADLAAMKLGYRSAYIIRAAEKYLEDGCPSCREELLSFHGVGPKVANCIMLFGLRDTAAFPIDTWVKHIMNDMYGFDENDVKGMQAFASEKFGELAGYAQQYLFYYYRDRKKQ